MKPQLQNTLDDIYSGEIVEKDGMFVCPVCEKEYKRKSAATKHFEERSCFKYQNLFKGTLVENKLYNLHKKFSAINGNRGWTIRKFRNSGQYTSIAKFYVYCANNNVNLEDYFDYAIHEFRFDSLATALKKAAMETQLRIFRDEAAHEYTNDDKDERFYNANEEWLGTRANTGKTIRALERGDISVDYLFNRIDFDQFLNNLTQHEMDRVAKVLERDQ